MDQHKVKDKATEAFSKGKFAKAAELYGEYCELDPKDLQARVRMGDAWAKARQKEKAIAAYRSAAEGYARDGFLPRAIAASKLILELDPAHKDVQVMLADLYARRTAGEGKSRSPPPGRNPATPIAALDAAPSPMTRLDAIELPTDDAPVALTDQMRVARPAPSEPPALSLTPESVPATAVEVRGVPLEIELDAEAAQEPPLELDTRRNGKSEPDGKVFDLSDELPPELELVPSQPDVATPPLPPPDAVDAPPGLAPRDLNADWEIVGEAPGPEAVPQPPPVVSAKLEEELEPEPIPLTTPKRAPSAPEPVSGPDLRPSGRIWVPAGGVAPELALAPPPAPANQSGWSQPPPPPAHPSDLQAGMRALSQFDELDMDDGGVSFVPPAPPPAPVEVTQFPPRAPPPAPADPEPVSAVAASEARMPSFTELELEGDSLLHAVEAAARAGRAQAGATAPAEDSFAIDEAPEAPSGSALPKIPLFSDLTPDAFIELFERCPLRRASLGERIIEQGSIGDSFFVICAGSVRVYRVDDSVRRDIATLEEGAFFGEMALLSDAPRTASVEAAAEDTQLLEISAPVLAQLSHRYPQVAQALKKFCRQRLLSNLMGSSALFRPFNKKERRELIEKFRARDVQRGEVIIREGDRSDGLYIVLSGETEVKKGDRTLARLNEGEIFGEMSLLQKTPASATVSAAKRTSLLRLPRPDFDAVVLSHPQILVLISELTDDRNRQNEALMGGVAQVGEEGLLLV